MSHVAPESSTASPTAAGEQGEQQSLYVEVTRYRGPGRPPKAYHHHGSTPAAWFGVIGSFVALILACVGVLQGINWTLVIVAGIVQVVVLIGALVLRTMGFGSE